MPVERIRDCLDWGRLVGMIERRGGHWRRISWWHISGGRRNAIHGITGLRHLPGRLSGQFLSHLPWGQVNVILASPLFGDRQLASIVVVRPFIMCPRRQRGSVCSGGHPRALSAHQAVACEMASVPTQITHNVGDIAAAASLSVVAVRVIRSCFPKGSIEHRQLSQLVALQVVLALWRGNGLLDDLVRELYRFHNGRQKLRGNDNVQVILIGVEVGIEKRGGPRRAPVVFGITRHRFALLDRPLPSDRQFRARLILNLPECLSSGTKQKTHEIDIGIVLDGNEKLLHGFRLLAISNGRHKVLDTLGCDFYKVASFLFELTIDSHISRVGAHAGFIVCGRRRRITPEVWIVANVSRGQETRNGTTSGYRLVH